MPEHPIQLRRAWLGLFGDDLRKVDLPETWDGPIPDRLSRSFHRPTIAADDELFLRVEAVAGVVRILLNGQDLPIEGRSGADFPIEKLGIARNELVLTLAPAIIPRGAAWGRIALVIRSRER